MASSTPQKDFNVAIVGGGVCGLTCAIALSQRGVRVDIFEAAVGSISPLCCFKIFLINNKTQSKFGEIGAGLGLGRMTFEFSPSLLDDNNHLDCRTELASYLERNRGLRRCLREIW